MKSRSLFAVVFCIFMLHTILFARSRDIIQIPNIPGYQTLKCDLHTHTVFSDGDVWPTARVDEAWAEGLDAIAITDHIEYQVHKEDLPKNHNRPYEIAKDRAKSLNIILIKGAEITRHMPPGHFNALFVDDIDKLDVKKWQDAIKAAIDQGAFVFWNHPGWRQPNTIPIWYDEHTEIFENGWMHGIEIVNESEYYPLAFQWAIDKNLTMLGNTDIHSLVSLEYPVQTGSHRPMTLVFAKERTAESIHKALKAGRTAVWFDKVIMGKKEYLEPLFNNAIMIENTNIVLKGKERKALYIQNNSDIEFQLKANNNSDEIEFTETVVLEPHTITPIVIRAKSENLKGDKIITLTYSIKNLKTSPDTPLSTSIQPSIHFQ